MKIPLTSVALLAIALSATPSFASLIVNGSFETPVVPPGGTATYAGGSTAITGWTVVGVDSDLISGSFMQSGITFQAQEGAQWIDLAGHTSNSQSSGVTQDIATTIGLSYAISFYVGSATDNGLFYPSVIDLSINGGPRTTYTNPTAPSNMLDWELFSVPFTATQNTTNITFYNGGASNNYLSALDNIAVTVVPEPSTAIFGSVCLLAFCVRRRRS